MLKNKHKGTFCIESAEKVQKMLFMCVFECNKKESIRERVKALATAQKELKGNTPPLKILEIAPQTPPDIIIW